MTGPTGKDFWVAQDGYDKMLGEHSPPWSQDQLRDFKRRLGLIKTGQASLQARLDRFKALMVSGQRPSPEEWEAYERDRISQEAQTEKLATDLGNVNLDHLRARRQAREELIDLADRLADEDPQEAIAQANALITQWADEDHGVPVEGSRRTGKGGLSNQ